MERAESAMDGAFRSCSTRALVLSYLVHHRHVDTAVALQKAKCRECEDCAGVNVEEHEINMRKNAVEMVERGEIQEVMEMLPILSDPGFEHILCEMRYQRFIELVRADKLLGPNGALVYAQQHFSNGSNDARALELVALLAYSDPSSSPLSYWMDLRRRSEIAAQMNAALLRAAGHSEVDEMAQMLRHLSLVMRSKENDSIGVIDSEWTLERFMEKREGTSPRQRDVVDFMDVAFE